MWLALDAGQRAEVEATLARLIAKVVVAPDEPAAETEEKGDE